MIRLSGVIAVGARNAMVLRRMVWTAIVAHIGEPLFYFAVFGYGLGKLVGSVEGQPYLEWVVPGICIASASMSASMESTYTVFTRMERQKTYLAIASTPVSVEEIVLGEALWASALGATNSCFVLAAAFVFGVQFSLGHTLGIIALSLASAVVGASLALWYTSRAAGYEAFAVYFTLIVTPLQVLSGAWFPIALFPEPLAIAVYALPFTLPVQAARAGGPFMLTAVIVALLYAAPLLILAVRGIRRRVIV